MHGDVALALILMTAGAMAMPAAARMLAIPVAVTEILYGVLLGQSGLQLVSDDSTFMTALSELGFALFLFLAGLEIDFRGFEKRGLRSLALPFLLAGLAFALALGVAYVFNWGTWVGLAVGATAVPLLLAVVREARLNGTALGNTMISFAAMGELLTIVLLTVVEITEHAHGDPVLLAEGGGRVLAFCAVVVVVLLLLRTLLWWYPHLFARLVAHDDPSEFGVRVGFGLMLLFVGLSLAAHVEPFLGAFVAGTLLSFVVREADALEHKLASMAYGFFVPLFFMYVGVRLQVSVELITENALWIIGIITVMFSVKVLPGLLLFLRGLDGRQVVATSALLAAPLTLVIAIMDLGHRAGAVDAETQAVVITAGIMASLLFPSGARALLKSDAEPVSTNTAAAH
jgi:Kef-type K+ transport system membrane component KefB